MPTRVLARGNWQDESGEVVAPGVPGFLPQPVGMEGRRLNRLDLARWLTSTENPLTPRVFANRLWKQFFGTGLSAVMEDVGAQGEWPSHPELLDWLAVEFRDGGWDVKGLVKHDRDVGHLSPGRAAPPRASRGRPGQPTARLAERPGGWRRSSSATTPWRSPACSTPRSAARA